MKGKILFQDDKYFIEFTKVVKNCFGCKPYDKLVNIRLHPDDEKIIESNPLNRLEIIMGVKNQVEFELVYGEHGVDYPKINWVYMEGEESKEVVDANGIINSNSIEVLANDRFNLVSDEGLFPNHTDKDIWISGFIDGYSEMRKVMKQYIIEAYNEGQKNQALSSFYPKGDIYYNTKFKKD
jgi:hypothetical protein